jgi:hypothetical protein
MQRTKPDLLDQKRHPSVARDALEDIKEAGSSTGYKEANRDRALGEADRTGRHFDEVDEGTEASEEHEAD